MQAHLVGRNHENQLRMGNILKNVFIPRFWPFNSIRCVFSELRVAVGGYFNSLWKDGVHLQLETFVFREIGESWHWRLAAGGGSDSRYKFGVWGEESHSWFALQASRWMLSPAEGEPVPAHASEQDVSFSGGSSPFLSAVFLHFNLYTHI